MYPAYLVDSSNVYPALAALAIIGIFIWLRKVTGGNLRERFSQLSVMEEAEEPAYGDVHEVPSLPGPTEET